MKKTRLGLGLFLLAGLSIGLFAWRDRAYITPSQQVAIYSLANRYLEAFCRRPADLEQLFEGSLIPGSLIRKSSDFLQEMIMVEGECYGQSIRDMQEDILHEIRRMPKELISAELTSELAVGDFLDCLVEVEQSFSSLRQATISIFECIDEHLDIRGMWHHMLRPQQPEPPGYPYDRYPEPEVVILPSPEPPHYYPEPGTEAPAEPGEEPNSEDPIVEPKP